MSDAVTCPRCQGLGYDPEPTAECCGKSRVCGLGKCEGPVPTQQPCNLCFGLCTMPAHEAFDYALLEG